MATSSSRDIADLTPTDFAALKEDAVHDFYFLQPDGIRAPVRVSIDRQGRRDLRRILVDYFRGSYDLTTAAADRFSQEYKSYYRSKIDPKLYKELHIPGGKTHLCMSVLTPDVGEWLYKASRMILSSENLTHCAPEFEHLNRKS